MTNWKAGLALLASIVLIFAGLIFFAAHAHGQYTGSLPERPIPRIAYSTVTLTLGTAALVPASPMIGRRRILIQNQGPNAVNCGADANVTTSNGGFVLQAVGAVDSSRDIDLGYAIVNIPGSVAPYQTMGGVWCTVATATQVSPANLRVTEYQ